MKHKGRNRGMKNRNKRRAWEEDTMWTNPQTVMILMKVMHSWILLNHRPWSVMKTHDSCVKLGGVKGGQVSVVSADVNSVPEHSYRREVVSDARVVLNVVEPSCHIHILLLLLDGQVHYEWMDSKVHESISYGEQVASQVDLVLQVEVEVL